MLTKTIEKLELRGIANKTSKNFKNYYLINVEKEDGEAVQFYCDDPKAFPQGLKKGDNVVLTLELKQFGQKKDWVVVKVDKE